MSEGVDATPVTAFEPFGRSLREGQLSFPRCEECDLFHWYPKLRCPHCGSPQLSWSRVEGNGTLFSWTTVRHAFSDAYQEAIPYVVALVEFDDAPGVRFISNLTAVDLDAIRIGMRVVPSYAHASEDPPRVVFVPAG
jgi:uncharacterized OB-fold protein